MTQDIDWAGIRAAAVVIGVREAARRAAANLTQEEQTRFTMRVLKRSEREGWIKVGESNPAPSDVHAKPMSSTVINGGDLLLGKLAELGDETKLNLAKGLHKGAEHVAQLDGPDILAEAKSIHSLTQSTALVHSWKGIAGESNQVLSIAFLQACGTQPEQAKAHIVEEQ